jgi:2-oxo-3-hexenedioate decarboxylase
MNQIQIAELAQNLHKARLSSSEVISLTKSNGEFPLAEAYQIQAQGIELRLAEGEKIIGYKMGLTSKAKMEQMGLHQPIFGVLTNVMEVKNQASFSMKNKIHPKAEPEIYFRTHTALSGKPTPEEALAACSEVGVALEILDSRFQGFKYFTLPDVVADNSSSAYFVLGESIKTPLSVQLKDLAIEIRENDTMVFSAQGSAILGDPILSLCELIKLLGEQGKSLPAGSVVLAGAATQAIELKAGQQISATLEKVGRASFTVSN